MLRFALPVTLRQELFILSSGHHLRRTPRLAAIKLFLKLLRSLTARPAMLLPNAPSKSLFRCSYCNRRRAATSLNPFSTFITPRVGRPASDSPRAIPAHCAGRLATLRAAPLAFRADFNSPKVSCELID